MITVQRIDQPNISSARTGEQGQERPIEIITIVNPDNDPAIVDISFAAGKYTYNIHLSSEEAFRLAQSILLHMGIE